MTEAAVATTEVATSDDLSSGDGGLLEDIPQEALDAAKEALEEGEAPTDEEAPQKPQTEEKAKAKSKDEADLEDIERILKQRTEKVKEKQALREQFKKQEMELQQRAEQLKQKESQIDAAVDWFKKFKSDPVEAVRMGGWEPEEFIAALARVGTPEHKQQEKESLYEQRIQRLEQELKAKQENEKQQQLRMQQQAIERAHIEANRTFHQMATTDEFPTLQRLFSGHRAPQLIREANEVAEEYYRAKGKPVDLQDLATYLEQEYSSAVAAPAKGAKRVTTPQKRGLSLGSLGSERGIGEEPDPDDDEEESVRKAMAAVKLQLRR